MLKFLALDLEHLRCDGLVRLVRVAHALVEDNLQAAACWVGLPGVR